MWGDKIAKDETHIMFAVVYYDGLYDNRAECDTYFDIEKAQKAAKEVNGVVVKLERKITDTATIVEGA